MNPIISNPFATDPGSSPARGGVGTMRPLNAQFRIADETAVLHISPMRAIHVFDAVRRVEDEPAVTLLTAPRGAPADARPVLPADAVLDRAGIRPVQRFGEDTIILDDTRLVQLLSAVPIEDLHAVRVCGPIEIRDANAIVSAVQKGVSPLTVECRATCSILVARNEDVLVESPARQSALSIVSEDIRHYLSALTGTPASQIAPVPLWQVDRLLSLTGRIMVRPIESQAFSSFIDVGVNTSQTGEERPADRCLIYDVPSNSWHDDA